MRRPEYLRSEMIAIDPADSLDIHTELDWRTVEATLGSAEGSRA